jgi:hypothetical protein
VFLIFNFIFVRSLRATRLRAKYFGY